MKREMKMAIIIVLVFIYITVSKPLNEAGAYTCAEQPEPLEALKEYDTVFSGKVIDMKVEKIKFPNTSMHKMYVTFQVDRTWQGSSQDRIEIISSVGQLELEKEKEYLVYANTVEKDHQIFKKGDLSISVCSRTTELSKAGYDLQQLGEGRIPMQNVQVKEQGDGFYLVISVVLLVLVGGLITLLYYGSKKYKNK